MLTPSAAAVVFFLILQLQKYKTKCRDETEKNPEERKTIVLFMR